MSGTFPRPHRSEFRIEYAGLAYYVVRGVARWGPFTYYVSASDQIDRLCAP
jgi:hypothetical protein